MREYASFRDSRPDSAVTGLRSMMCAPGMDLSEPEIATIVGLRWVVELQIPCTRPGELSSSQSITTRSACFIDNQCGACKGFKQKFDAIEKSRRILSSVRSTEASCETSKHSNATSGVIVVTSSAVAISFCCRPLSNLSAFK